MSSSITSLNSTQHSAATHATPQQVKASSRDADGDNDGSKLAAIEKPKATSGNIGTIVNTTA